MEVRRPPPRAGQLRRMSDRRDASLLDTDNRRLRPVGRAVVRGDVPFVA